MVRTWRKVRALMSSCWKGYHLQFYRWELLAWRKGASINPDRCADIWLRCRFLGGEEQAVLGGGIGTEWRGCWSFRGGSSRREHLHPRHPCPTLSDKRSGSQAGVCAESPGELLEPTSLGFPCRAPVSRTCRGGPGDLHFEWLPRWRDCCVLADHTGWKGSASFSPRMLAQGIIRFLPPTASFGHPYGRISLKVCLFTAVPGLCCCRRTFSSWGRGGCSSFGCVGAVVKQWTGTWALPWPGLEPVSPALVGRFFTLECLAGSYVLNLKNLPVNLVKCFHHRCF